METVAAPVEDDLGNILGFGFISNQPADRRGHLRLFRFGEIVVGSADERSAGGIINQLSANMLEAAENSQTRPSGRTADASANAPMTAEASLVFGGGVPGHMIILLPLL